MRVRQRHIPVLVSLFSSAPLCCSTRPCTLSSSPPATPAGSITHPLSKDQRSSTTALTHASTDRFAVPSALHDPAAAASSTTAGLQLSAAAATRLSKRSQESVLRQEVTALDLLYLMSAESRAAAQTRRHAKATAAAEAAGNGVRASTDAGRVSSPSGTDRAAELSDLLAGRRPARGSRGEQGPSSEAAAAHDSYSERHEAPVSARFQQQQRLFALRRRLAYMLADESTEGQENSSAGTVAETRLPALARRVALSLALAGDLCRVSAAGGVYESSGEGRGREGEGDGRGWYGSGGAEGGVAGSGGGAAREVPGRRSQWRDEESGSALLAVAQREAEAMMSTGGCLPHHPAAWAYAYRSLAQPLALTSGELDALLEWCAGQVQAHAAAVTAYVDHCAAKEPASWPSRIGVVEAVQKGRADALAKEKEGEEKGEEVEGKAVARPALTTATHPPATLRMASRHRSTPATPAIEKDKKEEENRASPDVPPSAAPRGLLSLSPVVCASCVEAVAAALDFASTFTQISALVVGSDGIGIVAAAADSAHPTQQRRHGDDSSSSSRSSSIGGMMEKDGEEDGDGETMLRGHMVSSVLRAACVVLARAKDAGVLAAHRQHVAAMSDGPTAAAAELSASAAAPSVAADSQACLRQTVRDLTFSEDVLRDALCCTRESWQQALRVAQDVQECNCHVQHALLSPEQEMGKSLNALTKAAQQEPDSTTGGERADVSCLTTLSAGTRIMLLYILAQHGQLSTVWALCRSWRYSAATHNPSLGPTQATDAQSDPVEPTLQLLVNTAAANAPPDAAAAILSGEQRAKDAPAQLSGLSLPLTQADAVEQVVRAGILPHRVLGVAEYAMLLRRMLDRQLQQRRQDGAGSDRGGLARSTAAEKPRWAVASRSHSSAVGWWLSPSQVWRFSADYPHHVRTTLCLAGCRVGARRGLTGPLSLEDLYVVLSITRQVAQQYRAEMHRRHRLLKAEPAEREVCDAAGSGEGRDELLSRQRRRSERWARWGVEVLPAASFPSSGATTAVSSAISAEGMNQADGAAASLRSCVSAMRTGSLFSSSLLRRLCAAFAAAAADGAGRGSRDEPQHPHLSQVLSAAPGRPSRGSPVLTSLVAREMLAVLRAVRYERRIGDLWETALRTVAAALQTTGGEGERDYASPSPSSSSSSFFPSQFGTPPSSLRFLQAAVATDLAERRRAERVVEEIALALAHAAEAALPSGLACASRLVAPLPHLAPHLSAFTVAALVQRPFRRALTWEGCLALLPYTPLGSRSQLWLLRRVAQDGDGRRHAFSPATATTAAAPSPPAPPRPSRVSPASAFFPHAAAQTAERLMEVQKHARRLQHRSHKETTTPKATRDGAAAAESLPDAEAGGRQGAAQPLSLSTAMESDAALLSLLLEGHWQRALRAFEAAAPRVRVAGAPHVVRLLVSADVWRDLSDTQRRPLVRLAVQSSALSSRGSGGATALLEEVLQTSLEHGMWHTGLYFHQCVAAEQPDVVRQCRRAQVYAAQLCRGLLERTSMTLTVAQLMTAARRGQWASASACFMRYATRTAATREEEQETTTGPLVPASDPAHLETSTPRDGGSAVQSAPPFRPAAPPADSVPGTSPAELRALIALMDASIDRTSSTAQTATTSTVSNGTSAFFAEGGGAVPAELMHVAQTVRYAMLHTPALWMHALRWLPPSALPLPYAHEAAIRALCAGNADRLRALLPEHTASAVVASGSPLAAAAATPAATTLTASPLDAGKAVTPVLATATTAALSLVAEARRDYRPQHPNGALTERQSAVAAALHTLRRAGAWQDATLLYEKAVEANCMPYAAAAAVLEAAAHGGAPWEVTLHYFCHMAQRMRPSVAATAVALQACAEGGQWAMAFRVLQQSVLTQSRPVPRLVELAVSTALHCGVWARALAAAQQYRRTRDPRLAHTVLLALVRTQHWDYAVEYFYDCTRRGIRPLDASLELAIVASEAASAEYRKTALMVGTIASALEDLYKLSGAVLEHIVFVQQHVRGGAAGTRAAAGGGGGGASVGMASMWLYDEVRPLVAHPLYPREAGGGRTGVAGQGDDARLQSMTIMVDKGPSVLSSAPPRAE